MPVAATRLGMRFYAQLPLRVPVKMPNGIEYEQPTGLFINNKFVRAKQGKTFEVVSPATEEEITHVYEAREDDVEDAIAAADQAFKSGVWSDADPLVRAKALNKLAELIEEDLETIASIETLDNGKAISSARGDVQLVANYLRSCAGWCDKIDGRLINTGSTHFSYTIRQPLGVCGQIIPWNFPLLMWAWKVGPALATGNTVVLKTAESTPLSALYVSQFVPKAGIPAGVVNIISGFGKIKIMLASQENGKAKAKSGNRNTSPSSVDNAKSGDQKSRNAKSSALNDEDHAHLLSRKVIPINSTDDFTEELEISVMEEDD